MSGETASQWINTAPRPVEPEYFSLAKDPKMGRFNLRPDDTEVALNSMAVSLPDEPLWINGSPYMLVLHPERLVRPVNKTVRDGSGLRGEYQPRSLTVALDEDFETKDSNPQYYDAESTDITVEIPKELTKSDTADTEVVEQVQDMISNGIRIGLEQNYEIKWQFASRRRNLKLGRFTSALVGEGVGVASAAAADGSIFRIIEGGVVGIAAGYAAFAVLASGKALANKVRHGSDRKALVNKAVDRANENAYKYGNNGSKLPPRDEAYGDDNYEAKRKWFSYFKEPIVELRRISF